MAKLEGGKFDSSKHKDTLIPIGKYLVTMTESKSNQSKSKNGFHFDPGFTIAKGEHKGRKVFDCINYRNTNPITQEIGQNRMGSLTRSVFGFDKVWEDSVELHGKPLELKIGIQEADGDYPEKNIILKYFPPKTDLPLREKPSTAPSQESPPGWMSASEPEPEPKE